MKSSKIHITQHAMRRLRERVGSYGSYRDWKDYVRAVRYKGRDIDDATEEELAWLDLHPQKAMENGRLRFWDGFIFVFMGDNGHAKTLVTVIQLDEPH